MSRPELDYAGLCSVLVSTTSYIGEKEEEVPLGMRATISCAHCGKPGHTARECWTAHPELNPEGRNKMKCFGCQKVGHLKRDCPERGSRNRQNKISYNTTNIDDYPKPRQQNRTCTHPIVDSGCTMHLTNNAHKLTPPTTTTQTVEIRQANGETLKATHKRNMTLTHNTGKTLILEDVLLVPEVSEDLISVRSLNEKGYSVNFAPDHGVITKGG